MTPDHRTFALRPGDHAAYAIRDGAGAVALTRAAGTVAVDIETEGLGADQWNITAVSVGTANFAHVLHPVDDREAIRDAIATASTILMHNAPFDAPSLVAAGLMRRRDAAKVYDTIVSSRLAHPSETGGRRLGQACSMVLRDPEYDRTKRALEQRWRAATGLTKAAMFKTLRIDDEAFAIYAAWDAVMTARLHAGLPAAVYEHTTDHPFPTSGDAGLIIEREQTVSRILLAQTCRGITIDFDVIEELRLELAGRVNEADQLLARYGVNTDQGRELVKRDVMRCLDETGQLPASYKRLANGSPSADKRYLNQVVHPLVDALEMRSKADRFFTDYGRKLIHLSRDGRIHPQVAVCKALTGRMAYSTPPLQQYPEAVRRMLDFGEPVVSMDWASIEPVLAANLFHETKLIEQFEAGGDLYQPVVEAAGVERPIAKTVLLAQLYGQGVAKLAWLLGLDEDTTRDIVRRVTEYLGAIAKAIRVVRAVGDRHGKTQTAGGRIIPLDPDPRTGNSTFFGYKAINYLIQGSAYDVLSDVLYRIDRAGLGDAVRLAVHDELVVAADAANEIAQIMLTPPDFVCEAAGRRPVLRIGRVDLGTHWLPKKAG